MPTRLNKYLADRGICSRRKADELIEAGEVLINGTVAVMGQKVEDGDDVRLKGRAVAVEKPKPLYLALNKPVGIITSVDPMARDNVISLLGIPDRVFPIGRLDVASSGLLLLTNDGRLSEHITHPRYEHEKEYVVTVERDIDDGALGQMRSGITILGSLTQPAVVVRVPGRTRSFHITLKEGHNRQIRRMCEELGYRVVKLNRIRVMNIHLGDLEEGKWRNLTEAETKQLLASTLENEKPDDVRFR